MEKYEKKPVKLMSNKIRSSEISDIAIPEEKHTGIPVGIHTQSTLEAMFDD